MVLQPKLKPRGMSGGSVPRKRRIPGHTYRSGMSRKTKPAHSPVSVPVRTSAHGRASMPPRRYTDQGEADRKWRETMQRWCVENDVPFRQQRTERSDGAPLVEAMV